MRRDFRQIFFYDVIAHLKMTGNDYTKHNILFEPSVSIWMIKTCIAHSLAYTNNNIRAIQAI